MTLSEMFLLTAVLAFVILVIFLAKLCLAACSALKKMDSTLDTINLQLKAIEQEPKSILARVDAISAEIESQMKALSPWMRALSNTGEWIEYKSFSLKERCWIHSQKRKIALEEEQNCTFHDLAQLALSSIALWQKFTKRG